MSSLHFTSCSVYASGLKKTPALTLLQARKLVVTVLPLRSLNVQDALAILRYYNIRNHIAYKSHRKKRMASALAKKIKVPL